MPRSTRPESWLRNYSVYRDVPDLELVLNPGVIERISLPVAVTDAEERPIPIAAVTIDCPTDPYGTAVERGLAVTGEDGLTIDAFNKKERFEEVARIDVGAPGEHELILVNLRNLEEGGTVMGIGP